MTVAKDRLTCPNYFYNPYEKTLVQIEQTDQVSKMYTGHHFIRTQWIRNNPEKYEKVKHLQRIIFLPTSVPNFNNLHGEVHNNTRGFFERWGIDRNELIFNEEE